MSKYGLGLARVADLGRRQLIGFAILSAVVNGMVTASVGAWLAQTYAIYQKKTVAIQGIADLVYERRTRAGMVGGRASGDPNGCACSERLAPRIMEG
jgi:hypothetical protein